MADFAHCIGDSFYKQSEFSEEASRLGISRRQARLPEGLIPGQSRILTVFRAGRDSIPRKCTFCEGKELVKAVGNDGGVLGICRACGTQHPGKNRDKGKVPYYFIPDAIEVVIRVSEQDARDIAHGFKALGLLDAKLEEGPEVLRVLAHVQGKNPQDTLECLRELQALAGTELKCDVLAGVLALPGARVAVVAAESERGCGYRKTGGIYAVSGPSGSPLVAIPSIVWDGPHFRGLRRLTEEESAALDAHINGTQELKVLPLAKEDPDVAAAA